MKTELERLTERIQEITRIQDSCTHEWSEPYYDPTEREIIELGTQKIGVDIFAVPVHTRRYEKVDRWCVICKKCEKKEYYKTFEEAMAKTRTRTRSK